MMLTSFAMVVGIILLFAWYFGPRVELDTQFGIPDLPEDLDAYLASEESGCVDITPGAEKTIVWANPAKKNKTRFGFVYLHGFSATRQESAPVPDKIAGHFESNIYYARLTGNGRTDDAMAIGSVNRWINDAAQAMAIGEAIGEQVVIIGCSTGASLGWWIAHQAAFRKRIHSLIFFSPNFGVTDPRASILLYPWGGQIAKAIIGEYRSSPPVSEAHEKYWACRYPTIALMPMMGMVKLSKDYAANKTTFPVHITYSPYDDTVDASAIRKFFDALTTTKNALVIDKPDAASQHVILGDILAPKSNEEVITSVIEFIEQLPEIPKAQIT